MEKNFVLSELDLYVIGGLVRKKFWNGEEYEYNTEG